MFRYTLLILSLFVISLASESIDFDINSASKEANSTQKTVMIFFHKDYCGYCNRMEENIESKSINKIVKKDFIFFSINRDDDELVVYQDFRGNNRKFAKALGVNFYPTLVFLDANNSTVNDVVGYRDENQIREILSYISSESYKNMTLEDYKNELSLEE